MYASVRLGPRFLALPGLASVVFVAACGSSPGPTPSPSPSPATYNAAVNVFYDQDGNGTRDSDEPAVVPNVQVDIGGQQGVSKPGSGRVDISGVPGGAQPVLLQKLPPFYEAGAPLTLTVPQPNGVPVYVPATLPIGNNVPGLYMAFGDSITDGDGSFDNQGYRPGLLSKLRVHFDQGSIEQPGHRRHSQQGRSRPDPELPRLREARLHPHPLRHERLERRPVPRGLPLLHDRQPAGDDPDGEGPAQPAGHLDDHPLQHGVSTPACLRTATTGSST